jgi:hypothetical protein
LSPPMPSFQWLQLAFPLGMKLTEHKADHSCQSSAKFKMHGVIPPLLHIPS